MHSIEKIIDQFQIPIKQVLIKENLLSQAEDLVNSLGFYKKKILLVTDQNLQEYALVVAAQFSADLKKLVLINPRPDEKIVQQIIDCKNDAELIIALGSGTINDLCKLAAFRSKIPYIIFGTAPSMNGYASGNASIITEGRKNSLLAKLPHAIYLDLNILNKAPQRLIRAGIGDSLCLSTCQFDWLLSNFLLGSYYNQTAFDLLYPYHQKLINENNIEDKNFIKILAEILIISGLGMFISGGSYPASQGEHLIAHYIEIKYPEIAQKSYHGEQIAITTLTMAKIQEEILKINYLQIKAFQFDLNYLQKIFKPELAWHFNQEISKKMINEKRATEINQNLANNWPEIKLELAKNMINSQKLSQISQKFVLPQNPQMIGINNNIYQEAVDCAYLIRDRFTSLDLKKIIKNGIIH